MLDTASHGKRCSSFWSHLGLVPFDMSLSDHRQLYLLQSVEKGPSALRVTSGRGACRTAISRPGSISPKYPQAGGYGGSARGASRPGWTRGQDGFGHLGNRVPNAVNEDARSDQDQPHRHHKTVIAPGQVERDACDHGAAG